MRKGIMLALLMFFFAVLGFGYSGISVEAKVSSEQKKEYVNALSQAIRDGVTSKNMDIYAKVKYNKPQELAPILDDIFTQWDMAR